MCISLIQKNQTCCDKDRAGYLEEETQMQTTQKQWKISYEIYVKKDPSGGEFSNQGQADRFKQSEVNNTNKQMTKWK